MASFADTLTGLAEMQPAALRAGWRRLYRAPAPQLSPDLLARGIAWRIQEKRYGGLAPGVERELIRLAGQGGQPTAPVAASLRPGTKLVRSWNGETYSVLVTGDGFVFNDQIFRSLSSIAKAITGAKWSGPRFFGLRDAANARSALNA